MVHSIQLEYGAQYPANVLNMVHSIQLMYTACWIASSECIEHAGQYTGYVLDIILPMYTTQYPEHVGQYPANTWDVVKCC